MLIGKITFFWLQDEEDNLLRREDSSDDEAVLCKDEKCTGTLKKRASRKTNHWLPRIHEDYYGPKHHRARHH